LASGHLSGDGPFTRRVNSLLEEQVGVSRALMTTSCTHALEMAALLMEIKEGDEVILPSFTFVSTANAFALRGARPAFVDIRPDTLNIDEQLVERACSERTKAIVVVHYAGVGCEMDAICAIAKSRGIQVVEDNAHGFFGRYRGRPLGTFGSTATLSFHETKNVCCGEGGALLINDGSLIDRAEVLREKGTDRSRFFRGLVDKYSWVDLGSSYLPSDLLAAFLLGQLEAAPRIQARRGEIWNRYNDGLAGWAVRNGVRLPHVPSHCEQPFHMYYLLFKSLEERERVRLRLQERGILAVFHYLPLHSSRMGKLFGGGIVSLPVTDRVSDCILRLPFYVGLTGDEQEEVIGTLTSMVL